MQMGGHVKFNQSLPEWVPVLAAKIGHALGVQAFTRVGVDQRGNHAQFLDTPVEFRNTAGDRLTPDLRQTANSAEHRGEKARLLRYDRVDLLGVPMHQP